MTVAKGGAKLDGSAPTNEPTGDDRIRIPAGHDSLEILAYELSWRLGRPVLNNTGLRINTALTLQWQSDDSAATTAAGPSLPTALQEQLGLRLDPVRGEADVLIVDAATLPAAN